MVPVSFFQRPYPSANSILLHGSRPILVDTGFGADSGALLSWLKAQNAAALSLVFNTHSHCDHSGGNHALQTRYGTPVAAQAGEADAVNRRDSNACCADWLRQPIEPYQVDHRLHDGDRLSTGTAAWQVVATPGHTDGHLSLHSAEHGILVLGDALHDADIGWLNFYRESTDSLEHAAESIERLATLPAHTGYSGHGPAITDLPAALSRARRRLHSWREQPERIAWHACKRIFSHGLMLTDGLAESAIPGVLLDAPWFRDYATLAFGKPPEAFVPQFISEMVRSKATHWRGGRLVAAAPHQVPAPEWAKAPTTPAKWPPLG